MTSADALTIAVIIGYVSAIVALYRANYLVGKLSKSVNELPSSKRSKD